MPKCVDCFARPCGRPRVTSRLVPACPERRSARSELVVRKRSGEVGDAREPRR